MLCPCCGCNCGVVVVTVPVVVVVEVEVEVEVEVTVEVGRIKHTETKHLPWLQSPQGATKRIGITKAHVLTTERVSPLRNLQLNNRCVGRGWVVDQAPHLRDRGRRAGNFSWRGLLLN